MYCPKCGAQISEGDTFCGRCGAPLANPVAAEPATVSAPVQGVPVKTQRTSGFAITALVLGILGISLLAIIFGAIAIHQTGKDPYLSGKGMAIAGLVLGCVGFLFEIIWIPIVTIGSMAFM